MSDKIEAFDIPTRRPDFRRPFTDGSLAIPTADLNATLDTPFTGMAHFGYGYTSPFQPFPFNSLPDMTHDMSKTMPMPMPVKQPRARSGRKMSMNDVKPIIPRARSANRALSFSQAEGAGRFGLGLQTHFEGERTDSVSPPDYPFALRWDGSGSLPSMQSFGTTIDEAIDSPLLSPSSQLLPMHDAEERSKKQRRRECHNQVEKRRREHINAKIEELSHLLPPQYSQVEEEEEEIEDESPKKRKQRRNSMAKKDAGPCKGRVLTQSVQYIQDLRRVNDIQNARIQQLEAVLAGAGFAQPPPVQPPVFYSPPGLQQMQPSPDTEPFHQPGWQYNAVFEADDYRSSSTSSDSRPLPRVRTDSDVELQMGVTGMDLDAVFTRRDEW